MKTKILLLLTFIGIISFFSWPIDDCSEKAKEVAFAKSLSEKQLSTLYTDTKSFFKDKERIHYGGTIPSQFSKLGIMAIRVHKGIHLRLQGCMDHWVDIVVFDEDTNPRIELWYDITRKDKLWTPKNT